MACAEVNVSSGELMTVKEEEGESGGNNHKTQVILHLQPILHGVNDDIADTGTTVLAIETHHEDSKAEGEEIEYGYPITCGDSRAVLLFKKFVCPGINVRCVKFNDQLISPKQFVHLAGKATLKDWKRAIRLGGVMLRKMMDSGQIDFYQHDTVCSNTCRSTKFDVLINSTRLPPGTSVQPSPSSLALDPLGGQVPPLTEVLHDAAEVEEAVGERFSAIAEWSPGVARLVNPTTANGHAAKRKRADTPDGVLSLWQGVADSGLMGEVLSSLQTEFLASLKGVEVRSENDNLQETDAIMLNSLCEMFGLLDSVKQTLDLRRSQNEESKIHNSIYASYAQLTINPQLFTHFSASTGQHHHIDRDSQSTMLQRNHEHSETGSQEKVHQRGREGAEKEDTSGIYKEPGQRNVKSREDPHLKSEEEEEAEGLHDIEKVIIGRKASKKHKSK
ncbi:glucocorticoid modulatory element-binding protein 1-like isoform X3 [Seriola aureovittata]|uniref:glucocorticoid modulatory element-binding protein 1-like isoform X3 n=1 Tax=Seriola aureovittata TaxID=2871759 RepID=UPI0024BE67F0|nr:glucocorticoid modulatory element-binding protein 1-like isoform X3 [Seriola aureovittata]